MSSHEHSSGDMNSCQPLHYGDSYHHTGTNLQILCHPHHCGCHWLGQNLPVTPDLPKTNHAQLCLAQFYLTTALPSGFFRVIEPF